MKFEPLRKYLLAKKGAVEDTPFGPESLVFKVMGKMFALTGLDDPEFKVNLKCDPDRSIELREQYDSIIAGFHMNKKHWNTITSDGSLSSQLFMQLIDHSYDLVVNGLPKKLRDQLKKQ